MANRGKELQSETGSSCRGLRGLEHTHTHTHPEHKLESVFQFADLRLPSQFIGDVLV